MRLLATADLHLGLKRFGRQTPEGNSRVVDFAKTLERFVDAAIEHGVDFAALLGDNFHTRHPGPRELALFTEQVQRAASSGIDVLVLPGNHDGMDTIGDPSSHTLAWMLAAQMPNVHVLTRPGVHRFVNAATGHEMIVTSLPYPHRRSLDTTSSDTPDERVEDVSRRVERLVEELGREAGDAARRLGIPSIFLGHLSVAAARLGSEQSMRIGWDVTIRRDVLDVFDFAFLGHIHRAQMIGEKVMYVGSPDPHLFEDAGQRKAFVLADLSPGKVDLTRIDSKARPMFDFNSVYEAGRFSIRLVALMPGAIVRITVHAHDARPTQSDLAEFREMFMQAGASLVIIDVTAPSTATRTAGVKAEDAPEAALEQWLAAQEDIPMEPTLTVGKQLIASTMTDAAQ